MLQYENSYRINYLLSGYREILADFINPTQFFFQYFNIDTCIGDGLDNWGRILNIGRAIYLTDYGNIFGFDVNPMNSIDYAQNFYSGDGALRGGTFFNANYHSERFVNLPDDAYRRLLRLKYLRTVCNGSLNTINTIMQVYFGDRGKPIITEGVMELTYNFSPISHIEPFETTLFNQIDILPTPVGVLQILIYS